MSKLRNLIGLVARFCGRPRRDPLTEAGIERLRAILMSDCDRLVIARRALAANDHDRVQKRSAIEVDGAVQITTLTRL